MMRAMWTSVSICLLLPIFVATSEGSEWTPEKKTAVEWVDELQTAHDDMAVYVWEHPELGFVEHKSAAKIQAFLEANGFTVKKGVSGIETAFVASWGSGKPVIGFVGEYDALPNLSQKRAVTEIQPVVEGAPGHGCGHNLFGAASATSAVAMAKTMEEHGLSGTVRFYGTPGEEAGGGKAYMARDGVWDDADAVIGWHPGSENSVHYSTCLAIQSVKIRFHGQSAHTGSGGTITRAALDAIELFNTGMNFMRDHMGNDIRIQYVITNAGEAPNVPPASAEVWYYLRAARRATVDEMYEWTKKIAEGAALMTQSEAEVQLIDGLWEYLPNRTLSEIGAANVDLIGSPPFTEEDQAYGKEVAQALGKMGIENIEPPYYDTEIQHPDLSGKFPDVPRGMHSTDFGNVSWIVPSVQFRAATHAKGTVGHTWIEVAQNAAPPGLRASLTVSKWMVATALDLVVNPEKLEAAKKELAEYLEDTPYYHPIPNDQPIPTFYEMYGCEWETVPKPPTYSK
jgi:aminobenzoyl-glutamate utilization protein B